MAQKTNLFGGITLSPRAKQLAYLKEHEEDMADFVKALSPKVESFPPDNNALDYQLFDFSRDNKFYNKEKKNGKSLPEVNIFLMTVRSTCSRILICEILIKLHRYQFLMRMG